MQLGDGRRVLLARRDRRDLDRGVSQENLHQFEGGVTGAAEDRDLEHSWQLAVGSWQSIEVSLEQFPRFDYTAHFSVQLPTDNWQPTTGHIMQTIHEAAAAIREGRLTAAELLE